MRVLCLLAFALFLHQSAFVQPSQEAPRESDAPTVLVQAFHGSLDHQQTVTPHGASQQQFQLAFIIDPPQDEPSPFGISYAPVIIPPSLSSLLLYTQTTSTLL
jgi:hypothetical protein